MLAAGIHAPVPLEELESHLREDIEQQIGSGINAQQAFEFAVQKIGEANMLENEFKKCEKPLMKQSSKIGVGVAGILVGAALQIPGDVHLRDELVLANGRLGLWLLGWLLIVWSLVQIRRPKGFKGRFVNVKKSMVKQSVKTGTGIVVLLIGGALMLPAATQVCSEGLIRFEALCWMMFGIALLLAGALVTFLPYENAKHNHV